MEDKIILLKALTGGYPRIKPTKIQFIEELAYNYGIEPRKALNLMIECNRQGLIEIDSMTKMVGITDEGRRFITENPRNNDSNSAIQAPNPEITKQKSKRQRDWGKVGAIATIVGIIVTILIYFTPVVLSKIHFH